MAEEDDTLSVLGTLRRTAGFLQRNIGNEISVTYVNATTETYAYHNGTTDFMTITVAYTDDSKANISSAKRTA